jgi:hypothetical protein
MPIVLRCGLPLEALVGVVSYRLAGLCELTVERDKCPRDDRRLLRPELAGLGSGGPDRRFGEHPRGATAAPAVN